MSIVSPAKKVPIDFTRAEGVGMGVDEAWHEGLPIQINLFRLGTCQLTDALAASHSQDLAVTHSHPFGHCKRARLAVYGQDRPVVVDRVGEGQHLGRVGL